MKNAGMAGAVALVGIGLSTIGLSGSLKAKSTNLLSNGVTPYVVDTALAFDPIGGSRPLEERPTQVFRLWSNGVVDFMNLSPDFYIQTGCGVSGGFEFYCGGKPFDEWLPFNESLSGYLPSQDMNGDRKVDAIDLGLILANWGPTSASLLFNPEVGSELPIAIECDWIMAGHPENPGTGIWDLTIYRSWDTGLIEMGWINGEQGACLRNALSCWDGWAPLPSTVPVGQAIGDFNRSGATDASDLGQLLGGWDN